MLLRDGPGFGLYFMTFEAMKRTFKVADNDRKEHNFWGMSDSQVALRQFLSGGIAGMITWTAAFPADTIKTRLQSEKGSKRSSALQMIIRTV
jgi:solute carrier family 25 carnitine/acylcarnitine transporter 20/29